MTTIEQPTETTTGPDLAGLRMVLAAVEQAPANEFDPGVWECGTSACAIGWFCRLHPNDRLRMKTVGRICIPILEGWEVGSDGVGRRFGLSRYEVDTLFGDESPHRRDAFLEQLEQFIVDREMGLAAKVAEMRRL